MEVVLLLKSIGLLLSIGILTVLLYPIIGNVTGKYIDWMENKLRRY